MTIIWEPRHDREVSMWVEIARRLNAQHFIPAAAEIDANQRYPLEHLPVLRENKLPAMFVPREYQGCGSSLRAITAVVEELARGCASTSAIMAALSLGAYPLVLAGSEAQKGELLGRLATDGEAVCFALSERDAGSDVSAIRTEATREGDGWRIKGEKCWLGNGGHSLRYIVFANTRTGRAQRDVTAFVVERSADGVLVDHYEDKLGIRGTTTTNLKLDTWVPASAQVGEEGTALRLALSTLAIGRVIIAAQANGIALAAFDEAARFAANRTTFGRSIIDHQGVGFKLADAAMRISASRMMMYEAADVFDAGGSIAMLGAMAKLLASEVSHDVVDDGVQILGGRGYVKPSPMERYYRDQRITEIYEGTSEIQRVVLSRAIKHEFGATGKDT